ncbi:PDR/VanB family oxidoreductase [Oceanisphaera psychrotolerans]|uniref:Ferredoxin n=1 Tax=Oceanisphaera psychrotolerans TaxID=1414654 RepID=A0A1J4QHE3_9GAMM|nr:PDR/VanB family oxidoreductase [Oceanisphaera psychrotolerans]OIN12386.1 ferredoxin [Oceanisphaera psychrotolerans]
MNGLLEVRVTAIHQLTPLIREFTLEGRNGRLPGFSAGSHVQVNMPLGERTLRNAYSLLGDPADSGHYRIAVRLQEDSRGGSRFMHEQVRVGDRLQLSPPANLFAPHSLARHHLMIAGGIGITPFLAYIAELSGGDASLSLHYACRGGLTDAYRDELAERLGDDLHIYDGAAGERLDLSALLGEQPLGTHLYVCGPESLLEAVRQTAVGLGWEEGRIHWEAFASAEPGEPFVAELAGSGRRIEVAADYSLLEALEQAGIEVPNLCRGGVCGQCSTRYLAGEVDHRDSFLDPHERASQLMPCVSRACGGQSLLLDL